MVPLLISSVLVLALVVIAIYLWQKPPSAGETDVPLLPSGQPLFIDGTPEGRALVSITADAETSAIAAAKRSELIERAAAGDKATLEEAREIIDESVYEDVLNRLIAVSDTEADLLSLVSYVSRHELRVTSKLAETFIESCKSAPDPKVTAKMLHLASVTDDATVYQGAVETAMDFWRAGHLAAVSPTELKALLDGEFWILSSPTRSSGAGFVLKRALRDARRELDAAHD